MAFGHGEAPDSFGLHARRARVKDAIPVVVVDNDKRSLENRQSVPNFTCRAQKGKGPTGYGRGSVDEALRWGSSFKLF